MTKESINKTNAEHVEEMKVAIAKLNFENKQTPEFESELSKICNALLKQLYINFTTGESIDYLEELDIKYAYRLYEQVKSEQFLLEHKEFSAKLYINTLESGEFENIVQISHIRDIKECPKMTNDFLSLLSKINSMQRFFVDVPEKLVKVEQHLLNILEIIFEEKIEIVINGEPVVSSTKKKA